MATVTTTDYTTDPPTVTTREETADELAQRENDAVAAAVETQTRAIANGNRATIHQQATAALDRNRAFVASTPTAAQTTAAVKDHARQLNGVIRLLLDALDGTD